MYTRANGCFFYAIGIATARLFTLWRINRVDRETSKEDGGDFCLMRGLVVGAVVSGCGCPLGKDQKSEKQDGGKPVEANKRHRDDPFWCRKVRAIL